VDIAILASRGRGKKKLFKEPIAILEVKMVATPANGNAVSRTIVSLERQLNERKKNWPNAKCFGLLAVRICGETFDDSTLAFNEVILSREKGLKPAPDLDRTLKNLAKQPNLSWAKPRTLVCGKDKFLQATVNLKWWLFSFR